jgi:transposase
MSIRAKPPDAQQRGWGHLNRYPYRIQGKGGKNDANDAAAICEAAGSVRTTYVPIKTAEQQGVMALHRVRVGFKEERTACINRIRGVLTEFGLGLRQEPQGVACGLA